MMQAAKLKICVVLLNFLVCWPIDLNKTWFCLFSTLQTRVAALILVNKLNKLRKGYIKDWSKKLFWGKTAIKNVLFLIYLCYFAKIVIKW